MYIYLKPFRNGNLCLLVSSGSPHRSCHTSLTQLSSGETQVILVSILLNLRKNDRQCDHVQYYAVYIAIVVTSMQFCGYYAWKHTSLKVIRFACFLISVMVYLSFIFRTLE